MSILYPTAATLKAIEQAKLPLLTMDDPTFTLFPQVTEDTVDLLWEQEDNYVGLQNVRGLNGQPGKVKPVGYKRFKAEPGFYGDYSELQEKEVTERRKLGTFGEVIDLNDVIMKRHDQLLGRRIDRQRKLVWDLLQNGTFSVAHENGGIVHTDTYPLQTGSASDWSVLTTATPLADLRALKLLARGYSVRFDKTATMYMNQTTANYLVNNQNANDLFGKRQEVGATFNSIEDVNKILAANDLPLIEVYDETYFTDAAPTTPVTFIADDKVVIVGKRKGNAPVGDVCAIRNANNPDCEPGPYTKVVDSSASSMNPVPRTIGVHDGWNGGIRLYYPSACIRLSV